MGYEVMLNSAWEIETAGFPANCRLVVFEQAMVRCGRISRDPRVQRARDVNT